jgi:hypothetical protein
MVYSVHYPPTCIHAYIHTYIHTNILTFSFSFSFSLSLSLTYRKAAAKPVTAEDRLYHIPDDIKVRVK